MLIKTVLKIMERDLKYKNNENEFEARTQLLTKHWTQFGIKCLS